VLWNLYVGASQDTTPFRILPPRRPRLLSVDDEPIGRLDGACSQGSQVRSSIRLRKTLAPYLLRRQDGWDESTSLRFVSVGQNRWSQDVQSDDGDPLGRACSSHFLINNYLFGWGPTTSAAIGGPSSTNISGREAERLPRSQELHPGS